MFKIIRKNNYHLFIVFVILVFSNVLIGQEYTGVIKDVEDNSTIPFVNVYFKNTSIGVISDIDGAYSIKKDNVTRHDTLVFSYLGYKTKKIGIKDLKRKSTIYLSNEASQLKAVIIHGKADPFTDRMMRKIINNKEKNNPINVRKVQFTEKTLTSVFLSNLDDDILNKKRYRDQKESFIKDSDSTVMMPIMLSKEEFLHTIDKDNHIDVSKNIYREHEGTYEQLNTLIKSAIDQKITQSVNFYDENIDLLGRSFQSPITSDYKSYYHLYFSDTVYVNGVKQYQFQYYPKHEKSIAFDGEFWVDAETLALTKIQATIPVEANVNFIQSLDIEKNYEKVNDQYWVVKSQKTNTSLSLIGSKNTKSSLYLVQKNQKFSGHNFNFEPNNYTKDSTAISDSNSFGTVMTEFESEIELDSLESKAIKGIRGLKKVGWIKFVDRFTAMTLNGFYNLNKIDLGPYFDFYVQNGIEGNRFSLPFRTSEKLSEKFTVGGYVGYGSKDKAYKYGLNAKFLLAKEKRTVLGVNHYDDYRSIAQSRYLEFVQENPFSRGGGNVLSVFADPSRLDYFMLKQQHFDVTLTYDATRNTRYLVRPFYDTFEENEFNRLVHNNINVNGFRGQGFLLDLRFSKARNFDQQFFSRMYYGSILPVYHFTAELGHNKLVDNIADFSAYYARLNASMKKKFLVGTGFLKMFFDTGCVLGTVPYPILNNPSGLQNLGLARFNYNLLNPISFTSDVFANLHLNYNGGGFLFNKIPLLSSLNIRESMSFKAFYGKLVGNHNEFFQLPVGLVELPNEPYMELGVGITNIFKALRVEYVRRINSGPIFDNISIKGAVRFRLEVSF